MKHRVECCQAPHRLEQRLSGSRIQMNNGHCDELDTVELWGRILGTTHLVKFVGWSLELDSRHEAVRENWWRERY